MWQGILGSRNLKGRFFRRLALLQHDRREKSRFRPSAHLCNTVERYLITRHSLGRRSDCNYERDKPMAAGESDLRREACLKWLRGSLAVVVVATVYLWRLDQPLLWPDEADTGIFARNVLRSGYPVAY